MYSTLVSANCYKCALFTLFLLTNLDDYVSKHKYLDVYVLLLLLLLLMIIIRRRICI